MKLIPRIRTDRRTLRPERESAKESFPGNVWNESKRCLWLIAPDGTRLLAAGDSHDNGTMIFSSEVLAGRDVIPPALLLSGLF
jgi:hypothetical protein